MRAVFDVYLMPAYLFVFHAIFFFSMILFVYLPFDIIFRCPIDDAMPDAIIYYFYAYADDEMRRRGMRRVRRGVAMLA